MVTTWRSGTSLDSLILILVSVTLSAVAQIAFKFGVSSDPGDGARALLGPLAKLVTPGVLVGLGLYAIGTILWLTALGRVDLSQAYPFVGVGFALTTLAGSRSAETERTIPLRRGITRLEHAAR